MYIIKRTDQEGGFVTAAGSEKAYTHNRSKARVFMTKEAAEADRCIGNEVVVQLHSFLHTIVVN